MAPRAPAVPPPREGSQRDLSWYTWHVWRRLFSQDLGNPDSYEVGTADSVKGACHRTRAGCVRGSRPAVDVPAPLSPVGVTQPPLDRPALVLAHEMCYVGTPGAPPGDGGAGGLRAATRSGRRARCVTVCALSLGVHTTPRRQVDVAFRRRGRGAVKEWMRSRTVDAEPGVLLWAARQEPTWSPPCQTVHAELGTEREGYTMLYA